MALQANATLIFTGYTPLENSLIQLFFTCANPGPGEASDYSVIVTDAEFTAANTNPLLQALATAKLNRKYRNTGFARLDNIVGASFTI